MSSFESQVAVSGFLLRPIEFASLFQLERRALSTRFGQMPIETKGQVVDCGFDPADAMALSANFPPTITKPMMSLAFCDLNRLSERLIG